MISLLFYFGLLSIKGVDMAGSPILHVTNLVVREQLFNFLIQGYIKHDIFKINLNKVIDSFEKYGLTERQEIPDRMREHLSIRDFTKNLIMLIEK